MYDILDIPICLLSCYSVLIWRIVLLLVVALIKNMAWYSDVFVLLILVGIVAFVRFILVVVSVLFRFVLRVLHIDDFASMRMPH